MRSTDPIPQLKRALAQELVKAMTGFRTTEIMSTVRIDQPRVSDLRRGRLERISVERMIRWLAQMGYEVELTLTQKRDTWLFKLD